MRVPIIQSWTSNTNDDVGVCWLLSLLYATRRSRMSHGEADVDLHAMRTLHARCRPASCVSFLFFFFFSHTLFLCSFQVVGKRHPPRYDWLGCFIFSFFEGGGTNSNNNNSYNNKNKKGESGGRGTCFHCDCSHAHDKTRCYAIHPRHAFTRSRSFRHPSPATCPPGSARRCDDIPANQSQRSQC